MNASLYQVYLVADRLSKLIADAGGSHSAIEMRTDGDTTHHQAFYNHHINFHLRASDDTAEGRESLVAELLARIPGAEIRRQDGKMTLRGEWSNGVTWYLWGGDGVCERIQVGTTTVLKPDPKAPLIEVEEPVFEIRCVDPLAEAVA